MSAAVESKELGTLIVVVGKARNLPNKSRFGKQDPFCTIRVNEEKQRTKAIKRGGQHPEWDEEFRFPIQEDLDDVLIRSESQSDSLNSSTDSPGVTTAAALASRSRKGPLGKKVGKSLRVACYADDAKEPEMIGECVVSIDEALKKGEVDEWYELLYKDKYSGEVYLELTFYSNNAPPVKRNMPRPSVSGYGMNGPNPPSSSSSLNGRPHMSTSLTASGSVSGMSLYIPPYVSPTRVPSPSPLPHSSSFADLGLPPGHRRQSLSPLPPGQPSYPPSGSSSTLPSSQSTLAAMDSLTRPMSSLSLSQSSRLLPLPAGSPAPPQPYQPQNDHHHRHSMSGPSEAPWGSLLTQTQPAPIPAPHLRPMSTSDVAPRDQGRSGATITPMTRPTSGMSYHSQQNGYPPSAHRAPSPIQNSLMPGDQPRPHPSSFSGSGQAQHPSTYLLPSPAPTPVPHSASAPPIPPNTGHYTMPTSSFAGLQPGISDPQRTPSPYAPVPQQIYGQVPYQSGPSQWQSPAPMQPQQAYASPGSNGYHNATDSSGYGQHPQSHTPQPYQAPPTPQPQPYAPPTPTPQQYQSHTPQPYGAPHTSQPHYTHQHSHSLSSLPPNPPRQPSPNPQPQQTQGYIPWYQQTAPPPQPTPQPQYAHTPPHNSYASPPPVPMQRPIPHPPAPKSHEVIGYYPSDEMYVAPQQDQWGHVHGHGQQGQDQEYHSQNGYIPQTSTSQPYRASTPQPDRATTPQPYRATTPQPYRATTPQPYPNPPQPYQYQSHTPQPPQPHTFSPAPQHPQQYQPLHSHSHSHSLSSLPPPERAPQGWQSTIPDNHARSPSPIPPPTSYYIPQAQYQPPPNPQRAPSPQPPPQSQQWQSQNILTQNINYSNLTNHPRSPSPNPSSARKDWKSYMQGLSTSTSTSTSTPPPPLPHQSYSDTRSGSPLPPPKDDGRGGAWYTPPPTLPSSIRPPEGWRSTVQEGAGGWRG